MSRAGSKLGRYVAECAELVGDLNDVADDHRFREAGGQLQYVVDYSEVHSYLLGGQPMVAISLIADAAHHGDPEAFELAALGGLFALRGRLRISVAHAIELEDSLLLRSTSDLHKLAEAYVDSERELVEFEESSNAVTLKALLERLRHGDSLSSDEFSLLESRLAEVAPSLFRFLSINSAQESLRDRLSALDLKVLDDEPLERLKDYRDDVDRLFHRLNELRPDRRAPNYLDARALATVDVANRYDDETNRFVLVSRSKKLHELRRKLSDDPEALGGLRWLRHPRTFTPFFGDPQGDAHAMLELSRRNAKRLELFALSMETRLFGPRTRKVAMGVVDVALRDALRLWRSSERSSVVAALAARLAETRRPDASARAGELVRTLLTVGRSLGDALADRLHGAVGRLLNDHAAYGWFMLTAEDTARRELASRVRVEQRRTVGGRTKAVVVDRSGVLQCTIQLEAPGPRRLLDEVLHADSAFELENVLAEFRALREDDIPLDELLLAMAFPLAVLGQWEVARMFAQGAVAEGRRRHSGLLHESLFFAAVCLRQTRRKKADLPTGLRNVREAGRLKRLVRGDPQYEDPRFLREEAALLQAARADERRARRSTGADLGPFPLDAVANLLLRTIELATSDSALRVLAWNGLVYLFLTEDWPRYRDDMHRALTSLSDELAKIFRSHEQWPANVLDTVAWATFENCGRHPDEPTKRWCEELLGLALDKRQFGPPDRERVRRHLDEVRSSRPGEASME